MSRPIFAGESLPWPLRRGLVSAICWAGMVLLLTAQLSTPSAIAQEPQLLRWKLPAGSAWQLRIAQRVESASSLRQTPVKVGLEIDLDLRWDVLEAGESSFRVRQQVQRARVSVQTGDAAAVQYDSAGIEPAAGGDPKLAEALQRLLKLQVEVVLNHRGQIEKLEVPEQAQEAWNQLDGSWRRLFSREGVEGLLQQALLVLPEQPVQPGGSWEQAQMVSSPLGEIKLVHSFQWVEPGEAASESLATLQQTSQIQELPQQGSALELQESDLGGTWKFDYQAGRLLEARTHQKLVARRPYRDLVITVRVDSRTQVNLTELSDE